MTSKFTPRLISSAEISNEIFELRRAYLRARLRSLPSDDVTTLRALLSVLYTAEMCCVNDISYQ